MINLDESRPNLTCPNLRDFPNDCSGGIGQLYLGTPLVCGGEDLELGERSCQCHQLQSGNWIPTAPLSECRLWASSVTLTSPSGEEIIYVAGGVGLRGNPLSSVEAYNGNFWNQLDYASMPRPSFYHCLVKINSSLLLVIGGVSNNQYSSATYFYSVRSNIWYPGPNLVIPRFGHACGVMDWLNPANNLTKKYVIVAGGNQQNGYVTNSVELLNFDDYVSSNIGWQTGPNLPRALSHGQIAEYHRSVVHLGGWEQGRWGDGTYIYKLTSPAGPWVLMRQSLKVLRDHFVTFLIPDDSTYCF